MKPLKKKPLPYAIDEELDQMYIDRCKHEQVNIDPATYEHVQLSPDDMLKITICHNFPTEGEKS